MFTCPTFLTLAALPAGAGLVSPSAAGAVLGVALLVVVLILALMVDRNETAPQGRGRAA